MRIGILEEINREQEKAHDKYGGIAHDDAHTPADWAHLIESYAALAKLACGGHNFRQQMIRIAQVAISAVESGDRVRDELDRRARAQQ